LEKDLGSILEHWTIAEIEQYLNSREERIASTRAAILRLQQHVNLTAEEGEELRQHQDAIRPSLAIIRELEWLIGLKKDLFTHYGLVAGIDPQAPFENRWD
jgi:hypothetical protein